MKFRSIQRTGWTLIFPPLTWLAEYKPSWLRRVIAFRPEASLLYINA